MYQTKTRCYDHCIVSINQPYVRSIIRGKQNKLIEFCAKLSVNQSCLVSWTLTNIFRWHKVFLDMGLIVGVQNYLMGLPNQKNL